MRQAGDHVEAKNYRIFLVINAIGYLGSAVHIGLIGIFYWLDYHTLSLLNIGSSLVWLYSWRINQQGLHGRAAILMALEVAIHTSIVVPVVGWNGGFQYYLMGSVPLFLFNYRLQTVSICLIVAAFAVLYSGLYAWTAHAEHIYNHPFVITFMHYFNVTVTFAAIGLSSYYFRLASVLAEEELEKLATTDMLTGLYNRRKMQQSLDIHHELVARGRTKSSLILADIDRFKSINDTYGHQCGDHVLREVSSIIRNRIRQTDMVARWGGEEFLMMLPYTDERDALKIAEELREAINEHVIRCADVTLTVQITFGVGEIIAGDSIEAALKYVDEALYSGKQAGRNRVVAVQRKKQCDPVM